MDHYYVNKNAQPTGEHEVHKSTCYWLPEASNRIYLGFLPTCEEAMEKAKEYYSNVDGCKVCCPSCHTR